MSDSGMNRDMRAVARTGLFMSEGEGEISRIIDLKSLARHYKKSFPVLTFRNLHSSGSLDSIRAEVKQKRLDSVVLAGESPLFYSTTRNGDLLLRILQDAGINSNRIAIVNLKEQAALPHRTVPAEATKKARALIDVGLEKVRLSKDVGMIEVAPKKTVAVIGTTAAGLFAAQRLLERGFHIFFIDRVMMRDVSAYKTDVMPTLAYVKRHSDAIFHDSPLEELYGYAGNFRIKLKDGVNLRAGGIVVAIEDDLEFTERLYPFLRLERDNEGYFKTIFSDTSVTETVNPGIFLIPHGTSFATTIASADSAAMSLDTLLKRHSIRHELFVSEVDADICGGCGTCIKTCLFHAAELDPVSKLSSTNIKRCVGCGNCVSACPTGARDQVSANTEYLLSAIKILSSYEPPGGIKLLYLVCEGCGYHSLDYAGREGLEYPTSVMPLSVRCAGRIDTQFILEAFREGFSGVVICKCAEDRCLNIVGNTDLDRRANLFRAVLNSRGISPERLRIFGVSDCDGSSCVKGAVDFIEHLGKMGRG
ncbi:MAG: hydrogenase iron-sulfur subunit [Nitrospirae bacterium]|nr:hydrogenase iron-sulfur subunit [Nitrospirota bacterium]